MSLAEPLISLGRLAAPLFYGLLAMSAAASLAGLAVLLLTRLLEGRLPPFWRYAMWLCMLAALLLPWRPHSPVAVLRESALSPQTIQAAQESQKTTLPQASDSKDTPVPDAISPKPSPASLWTATKEWGLPLLWLIVASACLLRLLIASLGLALRLRRESLPPLPSLSPLLNRCLSRLNMRRPVPALTLPWLRSPAVTGLLYPKLLLPAYASEMQAESVEHVLLHELSHCKRGDLLLYRLLLVLQAVHWFNPLLRLLFRCLRQDMELANDAAVLRVVEPTRHKEYSRSLVEVLGRSRGLSPLPGLLCMTEGGGQLERRLKNILRIPFYRKNRLLTAVLSLLLITAVAAIFLTVREEDSSPAAAVKQYLETLSQDESVLSLSLNSVREVSDPQHLENILADPDAYAMRLSRDNIALVDASINVQYDNTQVPYNSGDDQEIRFVLVRQSGEAPWVIAETGQGRGGVPYLNLSRLDQALALLDGKTDYIGNNSKAGALLSALTLPEGLTMDRFSLQTASEPYGITVHYISAPEASGFYAVPEQQGALRQNAALMLALIRNAGYVDVEIEEHDGIRTSLRLTREQADSLTGGDIRDYTVYSGRLLALLSALEEAAPAVSPDLPSASKGLELYIYKDPSDGGPVYSLLLGTDRKKTEREIYESPSLYRTTADVNRALSAYPQSPRLAIYQMNTTDYTKEQMLAMSDPLSLPSENYSITLGLWQPEP